MEVIYKNIKASISVLIALVMDSLCFNSLEAAPTTATPANGNSAKIIEDHSPFMPFGNQLRVDKEITDAPGTDPLGDHTQG